MLHQSTRQAARMLQADLGEAHRTFLEDVLFEAVVTAGAIVAAADGQADTSERAALVNFVERNHRLSTFTHDDTSDAFDTCIRQFDLSGGVPETAFDSLRRVTDSLGIRDVVCAAGKVAFADGRMQPDEEAALGLIQSTILPSPTTRHE